MNPRLAIAIILFCLSAVIMAAMAEGADFVDANTPLHLGASAVIGLGTAVATQGIDTPALRRATAVSLCMVPGIGKELMDERISGEDLFWDSVGCLTGLAVFEGVNIIAGHDRLALVGRW